MEGSGAGSVERVEAALARAEEAVGLGAFWSLYREGATAQVVGLGDGLPLSGVPVAVKDMLDVRGLPTTAGVRGRHPEARTDAEAVRRLRAGGAVPIGKTAMDPLGCTTGGQAPGHPPCVSPIDPRFSPGGSSSGSAVAVAAGVVPLAVGTDTAGSVRVPAAYTGIVGFKPAHRAVPRRGCVRVMPGFDTVGVLAPSVTGCVAAYRVLAGQANAVAEPAGRAGGVRVGVLTDLFESSDGPVAEACETVLRELERSGARLEPVEIGWRGQGLGVALAWELAEVWGERVDAEPERFTAVIRDTIAFGRTRGAAGHSEAMAGIRRARASLRRRFDAMNAVVCPTVPVPAPDRDRERTEVSTRFTRLFSALGWPAFSVPAGRDRDGRPIGIQVSGPPSRVADVIEVAARADRTAAE